MLEAALVVIALIATAAGVALFRRIAFSAGILDHPNERSSHERPVPRGGGVVMVVVCLSLFVAASHYLHVPANWGYILGSVLISAVSWLDDVRPLPALARFVTHGFAAAVVIAASGPITGFEMPGVFRLDLGALAYVVAFVWIVWMINAYNFMDGIDGIAGGQAVTAGLGWAIIGYLYGDPLFISYGLVLAAAATGFLIHNWSPASVFMGDVGSAFLGFTFAVFPLLNSGRGSATESYFPAALALVWLFIADTAFTFFRRLFAGDTVWRAHRKHIYQRLVIGGYGHGSVALLYTVISAFCSGAFIVYLAVGGIISRLSLLVLLVLPALLFAYVMQKKFDLNVGK